MTNILFFLLKESICRIFTTDYKTISHGKVSNY